MRRLIFTFLCDSQDYCHFFRKIILFYLEVYALWAWRGRHPLHFGRRDFFFARCLHLASSAGCRGRHPLRFKPWGFFFAGCLHLASSAGCRGRHPLRFKPRDLLLQYVCTSQARRDVEDAIPYILDDETFFHRMSAPRKLGGMSRTPYTTV